MIDSDNSKATWTRRESVMFFCGLILLFVGAGIALLARRKGIDDFKYLYGLSRMLLYGLNAYHVPEYAGANLAYLGLEYQPYPPAVGILLIPYALLPYKIAVACWTITIAAVFLLGTWTLCRFIIRGRHPGLVMLILGACMCSASFRHGITSLQIAPVQVGLFGLFVVAVERKHRSTMFLWALLALGLKFTNGLPFLGLLLLRRRYATLGAVSAVFVAANLIGFARMGGIHVLADYQSNLLLVEWFPVNSPDPFLKDSLIRLDWEFLLNFFHIGAGAARLVSKLLIVLCLGWLVIEGRRVRSVHDTWDCLAAFAAPLTCVSMLSVYHHHYEAIFFIPLLLLYGFASDTIRSSMGVRLFAAMVLPFILLYSVPLVVPVGEHFGVVAAALYKSVGAIVATAALFSSLAVLRSYVGGLACVTDEAWFPNPDVG